MPKTSIQTIPLTKIQFPEIQLATRDAHKLRGYFGNLFKEHSPLLHNHYEDGTFRYRYPQVQYKVIDKTPTLVGILEGSELLTQLFLKINEIDIEGLKYQVHSKNISQENVNCGYSNEIHEYQFKTLWYALNQANYKEYSQLKNQAEKEAMLNRILIGQMLSFFTNIELQLKPEERLMTKVKVSERSSQLKGNRLIVFKGSFVSNAILPNHIGIGRSVSRGFGSIERI